MIAVTALLLAAMSRTTRASEGEAGLVLLFCDDSAIGAAEGWCGKLRNALANEVADFNLTVSPLYAHPLQDEPLHGLAPDAIAEKTSEAGAAFALWFSASCGERKNEVTVHVYDPHGRQLFSKCLQAPAHGSGVDCRDAAFRIRGLMTASFYLDHDMIKDMEAVVFQAAKQEGPVGPSGMYRSWVRLAYNYLLTGYPTKALWFHAVAFEIAVLPIARLEVFADGAVAFPQRYSQSPEADQLLTFENQQFFVGLGVRYELLKLGPVGILPAAGLSLGISDTTVTLPQIREFRRYNGSIWGGAEIRVNVSRRVAITAAMRLENLFNYESFTWKGETMFGFSQFRFGAAFGIRADL